MRKMKYLLMGIFFLAVAAAIGLALVRNHRSGIAYEKIEDAHWDKKSDSLDRENCVVITKVRYINPEDCEEYSREDGRIFYSCNTWYGFSGIRIDWLKDGKIVKTRFDW